MSRFKFLGFALSLMFATLLPGPGSTALCADTASGPAKVAVLPFTMHTPSQMAYLQDGIRDMLTSRLAWQGKVQVIEKAATEQALRGSKADLSVEDAQRVGNSLKADYVVFGSVTGLGQSISIDAKVIKTSGGGDPVSLYAQTKSLDDVVPKINQFAQEINQKIFSRPSEQAQAATTDSESAMTRNPELLIPDTMVAGDKLSYLNPNFIEVTPEGSVRQPGLWRSQTFRGGIVGMDVGDLDGDGHPEIVTVTQRQVAAYRKEAQALKQLAVFDGTTADHFLWVSVVDVNRDGASEIYVTNLRTRQSSRATGSESITAGDSDTKEQLASFGLALAGGKLKPTCTNVAYFLNGIELSQRGKVLLGQERGHPKEGPFKPDIYEMHLKGSDLAPMTQLNVPSRCNVFNFAKADINNDRSEEIIMIDGSNHLLILSATGDQLWKSDKAFAATTNAFVGKVEDLRYNSLEYFNIPSPILVMDVNKDGIPELVVNRTSDTLARFMPEGLKTYDRGEIVSLSWDQLGLIENWKTREISGMVTSIRMVDANGDGTPELMASLVLAKDFLKLWDSKSTVISYDLNITGSKTAAKTP